AAASVSDSSGWGATGTRPASVGWNVPGNSSMRWSLATRLVAPGHRPYLWPTRSNPWTERHGKNDRLAARRRLQLRGRPVRGDRALARRDLLPLPPLPATQRSGGSAE